MFLDRGSTRRKPAVKSTEKGPRPRPGLKPLLSSFPEIHLAFAEQKVNTLSDWKKKSNKILQIFIRVLKNKIPKNNENNLKKNSPKDSTMSWWETGSSSPGHEHDLCPPPQTVAIFNLFTWQPNVWGLDPIMFNEACDLYCPSLHFLPWVTCAHPLCSSLCIKGRNTGRQLRTVKLSQLFF